MTLTSELAIRFGVKLDGVVDLGSAQSKLSKSLVVSLADGVAAGQANRVWADTLTIAASATQDIDLAGALLDALGGTVVLARVKGLFVYAHSDNTNNVDVGGAASNPWIGLLGATHKVTLRPGAVFAVAAGQADALGYPVVAATGDILRLTNAAAGTSVTVDIAVIGANA